MKKCAEARQWLDAYLDDELDLVNTLAIEQHLQTCAACSKVLGERRALGEAIRAVPRFAAPAELRARIRLSQLAGARTLLKQATGKPKKSS